MTTLALIQEAIAALKERDGSSVQAITKWLESEKNVTPKKHVMKQALKKGVESGLITMVKNSYKLSPQAKKKMKGVAAKAKAESSVPKTKKAATTPNNETKKEASKPKKKTPGSTKTSTPEAGKVPTKKKAVNATDLSKAQAPKKKTNAKTADSEKASTKKKTLKRTGTRARAPKKPNVESQKKKKTHDKNESADSPAHVENAEQEESTGKQEAMATGVSSEETASPAVSLAAVPTRGVGLEVTKPAVAAC